MASVGDVPFGSFGLAEDGRALNPLINSGALVVCELLSRTHSEEEVGRWCRSVGGPRDAGPVLFSNSRGLLCFRIR